MYAPQFDYYRANSVKDARDLLQKHPGAKLLAGGHSLIPLLKLRLTAPPVLIDIGRIGALRGVELQNGTIRIGALTTHAELSESAVLANHCKALAEAAAQIGDPAVRNRGTIGGNVAHADPASDLPTVLVAVDGRFSIAGPRGERILNADEFFKDMMTTALDADDILTAIEIAPQPAGYGTAYVKFAHPASRYAVIGVAAVLSTAGGKCTGASVALGGLVGRPIRARAVEQALADEVLSAETMAEAAGQVTQDLGGDILGDIFASAEYRKAVAPVWVERALTRAFERAP